MIVQELKPDFLSRALDVARARIALVGSGSELRGLHERPLIVEKSRLRRNESADACGLARVSLFLVMFDLSGDGLAFSAAANGRIADFAPPQAGRFSFMRRF
jgi:hypothetical protein